MRWLKHVLTVGLLLAAGGLAAATAFSSHSGDYGKVALPAGGVIHLPKGTVTVYYSPDDSNPAGQQASSLNFEVLPVAGGDPIQVKSAGGEISADGVERSEVIGEHGAIAKLDVPDEGDYRVVAASEASAGSAGLEFGTNAATAVAAKWKVLGGLVLAAFLIGLLPTPRPRRRTEDHAAPSTSTALPSSPPRAPYAG
jgi:hypothetical protein